VVSDIDTINTRSRVFEKPANLFLTRRSRNVLESIETRQFDTLGEIGSTPSLRCGIAEKAAEITAEPAQRPAAPSSASVGLQECVDVSDSHSTKRSYRRRQ
jgi:hypothetical protein